MNALAGNLPDFESADWERIDGVNVFDAHDDHHPVSGEVIRSFDLPKLEAITLECNKRDKRGQPCPLTLGHTIDGKIPEKFQPEIVGYARNFRVDYDAKLQRWVIRATYYIRKDRLHDARTYPRVSVEYWPSDDIFDPISLIRRTPKRDLGQWTYSASGLRVCYERDSYMAGEGKKNPRDDSEPAAAPAVEPGSEMGPPPDFQKHFNYCMEQFYRSGQHMQYMQMFPGAPMGPAMGPQAMAMPGATNQQIPTPPASYTEDAEKQRMQKVDQSITAEQYHKDLAELRAQYQAERDARLTLEKRERHSRYERDLTALRAQGYLFDLAEEMEVVKDYEEAAFSKHADIIKKRYQRSSVGINAPMIATQAGASIGGSLQSNEEFTSEDLQAATRYMREKPKASWEECREYAVKNRSLVNGRK